LSPTEIPHPRLRKRPRVEPAKDRNVKPETRNQKRRITMKKLSQFITTLLLIVCLLFAFSPPPALAVSTTLPTTTDMGQNNKFLNIVLAAPTTTTVKSGSGVLVAIIVNTGASGGTATIYDSLTATGTKIGTALTTTTGITFPYNCRFGTGLTIVTATAASDITVIYR
jgi:hypothetical protein